MDDPERQFLEFRRTGDPTALAQVFDRIAPELLLVAAHLTVRQQAAQGGEPEDLVQSTFLAAIENAERYDGVRPLRQWLIGILVNVSREERRKTSRVPDPERLVSGEEPGPLVALEAAELAEQLGRVLTALPQHYRAALTLYLIHGLKPLAIAHVQGVSPATVRTQIRRGLELLRQALPAGLAVSTLLLTSARALAAVRKAVLDRAGELGGITPSRSWTPPPHSDLPTLSPAVPQALLAGFLVLGSAATWLLVDGFTGAGNRTRAEVPLAALDRAVSASQSAADGATTFARREPAGSHAGETTLTLRASFADRGEPAAGVQVSLLFHGVADPKLHERWVVTDESGVAVVNGVVAGTVELTSDRGSATTRIAIREGERHEALVEIPAGVDVAGCVVTGDGRPVAGADVWLSDYQFFAEGRVVATTGEDGLFRLRSVHPGRCLSVFAAGRRPSRLCPLAGEPGETLGVRVVLDEAGQEVTGRVADAEDRPVAGARVLLGERWPEDRQSAGDHGSGALRPPVWLTTDAAGGFHTSSAPAEAGTLSCWIRAPGFATWHRRVPLVRGPAIRVDARLTRGARIDGVVRDQAGTPVAAANVWVSQPDLDPPGRRVAPMWAIPCCATRADGSFELTGLRAGRMHVRAFADDGARAATAFDASAGQALRWDAVLAAAGGWRGHVVDEDGVPLADWRVEANALQLGAGPSVATTDARGAFLIGPCDPVPHRFTVHEPGSSWTGPALTRSALPAEREPLLLVIPRRSRATARLSGRVLDPAGAPAAVIVEVQADRPGLTVTRSDPRTGDFTAGPLPPGIYRVLIRVGFDVRAVLDPVEIAAEQTCELPVQHLEPTGRVRLRALRPDGAAARGGYARLSTLAGIPVTGWALDADATLSPAVSPGTYRLMIARGLPLTFATVQVRSGEECEAEIRLPEGFEQRIEVVPADEEPECQLLLEWRDGGGQLIGVERLEVPYRASWPLPAHLAPGTWQLQVSDGRGRRATARFSIDGLVTDARPVRLELR